MKIKLILLFHLPIMLMAQSYQSYNLLLKTHVTKDGQVDYKGLVKKKKNIDLIIGQWSSIDTKKLAKDDELAFYINLYNLHTIKLVLDHYPIKSIKDINGGKPWDLPLIKINQTSYTLNDLENKLIRAKFNDARIHFALNCAAQSCPPLYALAFEGKLLQQQLDARTTAFINDKKFNHFSAKKITVSKIFEWYAQDFGILTTFINKYVSSKVNASVAVAYQNYDWALNGK